jgi:hypothetical protein
MADELRCCECDAALVPKKTYFSYLGHTFHADVPRCPVCGEVFIPEGLAKGRMAEAEKSLESK